MAKTLVIRLANGVAVQGNACWALLDSNGQLLEEGAESLQFIGDKFSDSARQLDVLVLVDASRVLLSEVKLPEGQIRYARQVVPYLVEEQLAEDIDEVHVASAPAQKNQPVHTATVRHLDLIEWLDTLYSYDLSPAYIVSEALAVPWENDRIRVFLDKGTCLVRYGLYQAMACDRSNAITVIGLVLGDKPDVPVEICYSQHGDDELSAQQLKEQLAADSGDYPIRLLTWKESATEVMARSIYAGRAQTLNLLQGGYKVKTASDKSVIRWRQVVKTAAACVMVHLLLTLGGGMWFDWRAKVVAADSIALYKSWFPQARRVFNPRRQLESALASGEGVLSSQFLGLLNVLATSDTAGVSLTRVDYDARNSGVTIQLKAPDESTARLLQQAVSKQGLSAEVQSVTQQGSGVQASLFIGEAG